MQKGSLLCCCLEDDIHSWDHHKHVVNRNCTYLIILIIRLSLSDLFAAYSYLVWLENIINFLLIITKFIDSQSCNVLCLCYFGGIHWHKSIIISDWINVIGICQRCHLHVVSSKMIVAYQIVKYHWPSSHHKLIISRRGRINQLFGQENTLCALGERQWLTNCPFSG